MTKKIIIVGGGYGGTETIRQLRLRGVKDIDIELVSNKRYFENIIGATEIISEKLKDKELTYDLEKLSHYWDFKLTIDTIENIDLVRKKVTIARKEKDYDIIVVAVGAQPNFYDINGANFALPAYTISDFKRINEKLKQLNRDNLSVVIVGAGFVGLQTAAEILDLFKAMDKKVHVNVIEKMNSILPMYNNDLAKKIAFEQLTSRGIEFFLGNGVEQIKKEECVLEDGTTIEADLIIWSAGIKSSHITSNIVDANLSKGYIKVDEKLRINGRNDAYAIGDCAFVKINGKVAQKMAAEALEQAKTTAINIGLIVYGHKPHLSHTIHYTTDFPQAFLSIGGGNAILIGSEIPETVTAFPQLLHQILYLPGVDRIIDIFSKVMSDPQQASVGRTEYLLKKKIVIDEIMNRFP